MATRYDMVFEPIDEVIVGRESATGEWVSYEDHANEIRMCKEYIYRLERIINDNLDDLDDA